MTELHELSLCEARDALLRRECSALELTEHTLARIERIDPELRAFATPTPELARAQAREADAVLARGAPRSALEGIPIGLKDLCATRGAPTHAGTVVCRDWNPDGEATVAERLRLGGAVLVGKLKTTEGASGMHHPTVPPPINPWNANYWTGASSSGSGAATAAGLCFGSLGSDTGGSIRFPSLCCGLVGVKATWGRVSRHGVFPLAPSLDHVGPMTRRVEDAAAMLGVIAGRDERDPSTSFRAVDDYRASCGGGVRALRVGFDAAYCSDGVAAPIAGALERARDILGRAGAELHPVTMPQRAEAIPAWFVLCGAEAAASHAATYPERAADYGPALAALLDYGAKQDHAAVTQAHLDRLAVVEDFRRLFEGIDVLLSPATFDTPPTLDEGRTQMRGDGMRRIVSFTAYADLTGQPTLSLPAGLDDDGVPFGYQLVADRFDETSLFRAGGVLEAEGGWLDVPYPNL